MTILLALNITFKQHHISTLKQRQISTLKQRHISTLKQRHISPLKQRQISTLKQRQISMLKQRQVSTLFQRHISTLKQIHISSLKQRHISTLIRFNKIGCLFNIEFRRCFNVVSTCFSQLGCNWIRKLSIWIRESNNSMSEFSISNRDLSNLITEFSLISNRELSNLITEFSLIHLKSSVIGYVVLESSLIELERPLFADRDLNN